MCAVVLLALLALAIRILPAYRNVFTPQGVVLATTDPWYHLRRSQSIAANFPHAGAFDPYVGPPGARAVPTAPGLDVAIASVAVVLGLGHPDETLVARVAVWFPPLLGTLVVIPVFLLARRLWGPTAGLVAATVVVTIPGVLLQRSLLGHTDHHIAEALLAACAVALLVEALEAAVPARRRRLAVGAGLALAAHQLTWNHAWVLVLLLGVWLSAQWLADTLRGVDARPPLYVVLIALGVQVVIVAPFVNGVTLTRTGPLMTGTVIGIAAVLVALTSAAARLGLPRAAVVGAALAGGLAVVAGLAVLAPDAVEALHLALRRLSLDQAGATVGETRALVDPDAPFLSLFNELGLTPVFALPGAVLLCWSVVRRSRPGEALVLLTGLGLIAAGFLQRRFAYYLAVPVALLAGLAAAALLRRLGLLGDPGGSAPVRRLASSAALAGALAVLAGSALPTGYLIARERTGPGADWLATLSWLRTGTPEPFGGERSYLAPCPDDESALPAPAYTVLAWWDFGYWLTTVARRVPVANPTQSGASVAARFFLAQEEAAAVSIADGAGARYVVADWTLPMLYRAGAREPAGALAAIAAWAGVPWERFCESVTMKSSGKLPIPLFYPEYFRSMAVRMASFGGQAVQPSGVHLATFEPGESRPRQVRTFEWFADTDSATATLAKRDRALTRLVSIDPKRPCVPLEALQSFHEVQRSAVQLKSKTVATVRVFERR